MDGIQNHEESNYGLPQEIDLSKCTPHMKAYFEARAAFFKQYGIMDA